MEAHPLAQVEGEGLAVLRDRVALGELRDDAGLVVEGDQAVEEPVAHGDGRHVGGQGRVQGARPVLEAEPEEAGLGPGGAGEGQREAEGEKETGG
ncbi:hypothetical protein D3C86_1989950 [compost metagenome]